ncbi:multidrug/spermidine efflux SMR transporter subunit MdtJ [Frischella perrara]|uniref:Spermidine export protein MdtJ n=1 Tax=Frischella perrara TaxID=1267021 RepID=A0A0A7RZB1_FRIPE|nr:multidrug/spermidine efflux SMR transporter subunit MdtJ [Frischella perrara]AJA43907.1 Membrane transporter of cations and cationic drugs [Frischella perrara]PWV61944.1 spermidine export protein MdtJ [Frischella perrara]
MFYRLFLLLAILFEVTGTISMKYASIHGYQLGHLIMYVMITFSYICLAIAIKRIPIGIAYALWEGIGTVFIIFFSIILFNDPMSFQKILGLIIIFASIALIESGEKTTAKES